MPSSTTSFYSKARKKFREERGKDLKGSPRDKMNSKPAAGVDGGDDGADNTDADGTTSTDDIK